MDELQQEPGIIKEQELQLEFLYLPKMGGYGPKNGFRLRFLSSSKRVMYFTFTDSPNNSSDGVDIKYFKVYNRIKTEKEN